MKMRWAIYRPGAGFVSYHRTQTGAKRALDKQEAGAKKQGGYSQDYIMILDDVTREYRNTKYGDYDPDSDIRKE